MKRLLIIIGVAVVSFITGAVCMFLLMRQPAASVPKDWIKIVPAETPVLFDMTAIRHDIPMPTPGTIEGTAKYLERDKGIQVGYRLKLPIKPNPVSALPEKYRKTSDYGNGFTVGPPDQVSYTGKFTFDFQDADGFSLGKITGQPEILTAAADNSIQGMTDETVSQSIAERAKKIAVSFDAEKCNLCQ